MRAAVAIGVAVLAAGCGMKESMVLTRSHNALRDLAIDYARYQDQYGRPPAHADEVRKYVRERGNDAALKPGEVEPLTVQWGAKLDPGGPADRVLANGPVVAGRAWVLMQNGEVKEVGAADLSSAPKAEPVPVTPSGARP